MAKPATKGARAPANQNQGASAPSTAASAASQDSANVTAQAGQTGDMASALQRVQDGDHLQPDGGDALARQDDVERVAITRPHYALAITSIPARFCRAGRRFTHEETIIPLADLSEDEMVLLRDEPMLRVRGIQVNQEDVDLAATLAEQHEERA